MGHKNHKPNEISYSDTYDLSLLASSPRNFFPIVFECANNIFTDKNLKPRIKAIREAEKSYFEDNKNILRSFLFDINNLVADLKNFRHISTEIELFVQKYDSIKHNNQPIGEMFFKIADEICIFVNSIDNNSLLWLIKDYPWEAIFDFTKKAIQLLDDAAISIIRKERTSTLHSLYCLNKIRRLYDLNTRKEYYDRLVHNNMSYTANNFYSEAQNFETVLELSESHEATQLGFDVEEYKIHLSRLAVAIKTKQTKKSKKTISSEANKFIYEYSDKNEIQMGCLTYGNIKIQLTGLSAVLLHYMLKQKRPRTKYAIAEEIADHASDKQAQQARSAIQTVNRKLKKYFPENLLIYKDYAWLINPLYKDQIFLKN